MKHNIISTLIIVFSLSVIGKAAGPPIYLNAGDEGKSLLDSLERVRPLDTMSVAILSFNHAFFDRADADSKEKARRYFSGLTQSPLVQIYLLAIELMDIRDENGLEQFLSLFSGGPYKHAREILQKMQAVQIAQSSNDTILYIYTTSYLEASMHMCDCLYETSQALNKIRQRVSSGDSTKIFFIHLFEAKYAWNYANCNKLPQYLVNASQNLNLAECFATNSYQRLEVKNWKKRIFPAAADSLEMNTK